MRRILPFVVALIATETAAEPLTVASFLASKPAPGRYEINAYVVGGFECPPCPPGAHCEPCPPNSVYAADAATAVPLTFDRLNGTELVLHTKNPSTFEFGKRYRFNVELLATSSSGRAIADLTLLRGDPL